MISNPSSLKRILSSLAVSAVGSLLAVSAAVERVRNWKPTPTAGAREDLLISDTRDLHDSRMIIWMAPPILPSAAAKQMLQDDVLIGVVRSHVSSLGTMTFDPVDTLEANDGDGKPLKLLTQQDMPPTLNGAVATVEGVMSQSFGPYGKGFHWFVFAAGKVDACKEGGLAIPFAGEVYTYQTPVPGCQASQG